MASVSKDGTKRKSKSKQAARDLQDIATECSKTLAEMDFSEEIKIHTFSSR